MTQVTTDDRDIVDSSLLREIADATRDPQLYDEIMNKLFQRIDQDPKQWKIVYKVSPICIRLSLMIISPIFSV